MDALNAEPEEEQDLVARVLTAITGSVADANGDVLKMNAAFREWFEAFEIRQVRYIGLRVVPVISADALARMATRPPAFRDGRISAVSYGPDGEQDHYPGAPLCNTGYSAVPE